MSNLIIEFHPDAERQFESLALSEDENEQLAAAQISGLLQLVESLPDIRERMLEHYKTIYGVKPDGSVLDIDIKIIKELKSIAEDERYHIDAVRRIRERHEHPASDYRVFFAPRARRGGIFVCEILGIYKRDVAYSKATLIELEKRYKHEH